MASATSKSIQPELNRRSVLGAAAGAVVAAATSSIPQPASAENSPVRDRHDGRAALAAAIRSRQVSCVEVMTAYLDHIEKLNPKVNAIVASRTVRRLLAQSRERDAQLARGESMGPLHGFPHAVKDLVPVKGIPMTMGSPILKDFVPSADSIMVERLRKAGAIFIGKTNTPEFGLGSHTYNPVYGTTRNAYDQSRSAGGSSGGAAVALALRMLPVADGSDYGGSLRNPAGWNNVFGFRTSFGRVPADGRDAWLPSMGVLGPMARNVPDLAMLLAVQAGYDDRVPLSMAEDGDVSRAIGEGFQRHADRLVGRFQRLRALSARRAGGVRACAQDIRIDGMHRRGSAAGLFRSMRSGTPGCGCAHGKAAARCWPITTIRQNARS